MLLLVAMSLGIGEVKGTTVKNVKYMDWDDTQKKLVERTTPDDVNVTVLEGSTSTEVVELGGWYVVNGTVNYNGHFRLNSETHLILSDGAQLTCPMIGGSSCSLFVYGQGGHAEGSTNVAEGILNVKTGGIQEDNITINGGQVNTNATEPPTPISSSYYGIFAYYNLTINGGKVTAKSDYNDCIFANYDVTINGGQVAATAGVKGGSGIYASGKVTINDGQVTATATNTTGSFWYYGIWSNVIINGGQVTASGPHGGINGGDITLDGGDITLGWTKSTDFIKCSSYSVGSSGTLKTATGKRFDAYTYDGSGKETFSTTIEGGTTIDASGLTTTILRPANYKYGVKYLKPNASGSALVEDQTSEGVKVWELIGDETELGTDGEETWYVTTSETATFTNTITLKGNVHIILANGTTMSVGTSGSPIAGSGIVSTGSYNYNLSIHGQEGSTGKLNVFANGDAGIGVKDLTICGGCITSSNIKNDNFCDGIKSTGNLVIYGGQVTSTSTEGGYGIYANIFTLGWSDKENDFIRSSSYSVPDKQMRTADGKSFAVYSISGTTETLDGVVGEASGHIFLNNDNWSYGGYDYAQTALASKKLRPFEGSVVGAVVGQQYLAYNNKNSGFKLLNGDAKLYVVTSVAYNENKFEVGLTEVDAGMVKAGVPVIFANATEGNPLPVSIYLENSTASAVNSLKNFIACDGAKTVAELLIAAGLDYDDMLFFGLSGTSFKRVLLAKNDVPASGKCFLAIPKQAYMDGTLSLGTAGSGTRSLGIEMGGTTSLIDKGQLTMDNSAAAQWYSLDGRSLSKEPAQKGVYIRNGKKIVIR